MLQEGKYPEADKNGCCLFIIYDWENTKKKKKEMKFAHNPSPSAIMATV